MSCIELEQKPIYLMNIEIYLTWFWNKTIMFRAMKGLEKISTL